MAYRNVTTDELRLLRELLCLAGISGPDEWLAGLQVEGMDDGGMGSLLLFDKKLGEQRHDFGRRLAAVQFIDVDGIEVVATLNANTNGEPFELDIWKKDFSPLVEISLTFVPLRESKVGEE